MKRVSVIDLLFRWPPDGGARVELFHILRSLSRRALVNLIVPYWDWQMPRGHLENFPRGVHISRIPVDMSNYHRQWLPKLLGREARRFHPDTVLIADSWQIKPFLVDDLGGIPYIYRFYAYETTCLRAYGVAFRDGHRCEKNALTGTGGDLRFCQRCAFLWALRGHSRLFLHEFLASGAWLPGYARSVATRYARAKACLVSNSFMEERLAATCPRIHRIPSGVDTAFFRPKTTRGPSDLCTFLAVGRMNDPLKGMDTLLAAADSLWHETQQFRLMVTGIETSEKPYIVPLGWCSPDTMRELYGCSDVAVIPSHWWEPFGIVALESLACGVPVIASRVGGLISILGNNDHGLLVEAADVAALARAMVWMIEHPDERRKMGIRGVATMQRQYRWDILADTIGDILL